MLKSLLGSAALVLLSVVLASAQSVPLPADWNFMNATQQASWLCRHNPSRATTPCTSEPRPSSVLALPSNWNFMNADEQARWRRDSAVPAVPAAPQPSAVCGRACGQPWTDADFAASQRKLDQLEREIARGLAAGASFQASPVYRPSAVQRHAGNGSRLTFYGGSDGLSGSSTSLPPFEFYHFNNGVTGTATTIRPFTFYDFTNARGKSTTGTTTTIGQFDFHNFSNGVSGSSMTIGGTTFHNFSNGKTCTTQAIGASTFTNCY